MRVLSGGQWREGYLDEHRGPDQFRIAVRVWAPVEDVDDVYFAPARELRRLWNYVWEVGPVRLMRKVLSRLREGGRNEKFVAVGIGEIIEAPDGDSLTGTVVFVAPLHPRAVERVVLSREWLSPCPEGLAAPNEEELVCFEPGVIDPGHRGFQEVRAASVHSGEPLDEALLAELLESAKQALGEALRGAPSRALPVGPSAIEESHRRESSDAEGGFLRAVLYGYGHYAKTNVLPNLPDSIRVVAVHEVDPIQLGPVTSLAFSADSSPGLRDGIGYDVYFLAGYHHTHAPLAAAALRAGSWAVSEKPLVTTRPELEDLVDAATEHPDRYFAGFHKRYLAFNEHTHEDLDLRRGDPIHYYCIVYEVPLPARHWYRWPNARSRVTSNGCHWIDHYLHLNGFPQVVASGSHQFPDGDVQCWAEAENGACFSMVLTDKGSNRIGLEEYVEMRTRDRTATVVNNSIYRAESRSRILRKARTNKNLGYSTMYRTIAEKIARGAPGDPVSAIQRSSQLMLDLEEDRSRS